MLQFLNQSKIHCVFCIVFAGFMLAGCQNSSLLVQQPSQNTTEILSLWDFDHEVRYNKTKLADNKYQLEVEANGQVAFERLATFLLRKSYQLCRGYGFQLEMLDGIESFDHYRATPNLIMSNLKANLECPRS
ncbi:hypothetical protein [Colwellia sp. RSH04]|uniref:hypothetical protein n=1 Tax=Colwellia sp. RSH04 TaxID=2305464 RepID=UPI000E5751D5|nr:hypothetical protein [Colwellia sp. RSH04]RHW76254.1 hypothetical protein D1094_07970 [Colwellia sp. RSH04]